MSTVMFDIIEIAKLTTLYYYALTRKIQITGFSHLPVKYSTLSYEFDLGWPDF